MTKAIKQILTSHLTGKATPKELNQIADEILRVVQKGTDLEDLELLNLTKHLLIECSNSEFSGLFREDCISLANQIEKRVVDDLQGEVVN